MKNEDLTKIKNRFKELSELKNGWLDGDGKKIDTKTITYTQNFLLQLLNNFQIEHPAIYPTINGGIQAEWIINNILAIDLEFDETDIVKGYATNVKSNEDSINEIESNDINKIRDWFRQFND